jgi:starch phosphorylase
MKPLSTIIVKPSLPKAIENLEWLAYNLRWCWDPDTIEVFRRIDRERWEQVYHNPVRLLGEVSQERLEQLAEDPGFMAHLKRATASLKTFLENETWFARTHKHEVTDMRVAYFSAEFGLSESLPIYSGGLGILAGDHIKSANTLGLPFVGMGLLYQNGYFSQYLNNDGWQQEDYRGNDFYTMPVQRVQDDQGNDLTVTVSYPDGEARVRIWLVNVGRISLFLLDTNLEENPPRIREITSQLYGGDDEMRLRQEILLGIGGLRALDALKQRPTVCHMNEGHSAFLAIERIRQSMIEDGYSFEQATESTAAGNVFTTHTPVPAGHDVFPPALIEKYFKSYAQELGLSLPALMALGQADPTHTSSGFNMTVLAMRFASYRNGVSKLHGKVSREMWKGLWPNVPEDEIPITSITNGVHISSHISHQMRSLQDNYLGPRRLEEPQDQTIWQLINDIPPEELWRVHERRRERLVAFARTRLRQQLQRESASPVEIARADEVLNPGALTIGFARRFATYKRATLLFHDIERLTNILNNEERPVQVIFAGKAHPRDHAGKELIQEIYRLTQQEHLHRRLVFIENYDMCVARYLVQGVDIWLNTPLRPLEASGTSGMKALANGALNLSVLDGWWDEAYQLDVGWAIGHGEEYEDQAYQNEVEASDLYNILEKEAVPLFYDRGADDLPRGWVARMKHAMSALCPQFNTHRMVQEYAERFYLSAHARQQTLSANKANRAMVLAQWKQRVIKVWPQLHIQSVEAQDLTTSRIGDTFSATLKLTPGDLSETDLQVELYHGHIGANGEIEAGITTPMTFSKTEDDGTQVYVIDIPLKINGQWGYTTRVLPHHEDLICAYDMGLIIWA